MNGANIYIPIEIENLNSDILSYEVPSGGYFTDLGVDLLLSSHKIIDLIQYSNILPGLQFVFKNKKQLFVTKYFNYLDSFLEKLEHLDISNNLKNSIKETVALLQNNLLEQASNTEFAKLTIEDKISKFLVLDSYHTKILPNKDFLKTENIILLNSEETTLKLIELLNNDDSFSCDDFEPFYYWQNGQFLIDLVVSNKDDNSYNTYTIPLIISVCLMLTKNDVIDSLVTEIEDYLLLMTPNDKESFDIMSKILNENGIYNNYVDFMSKKDKIYLNNETELTCASKAGDKVFIEYRDKTEEIENSNEFDYTSWTFTLNILKNVKFFKVRTL